MASVTTSDPRASAGRIGARYRQSSDPYLMPVWGRFNGERGGLFRAALAVDTASRPRGRGRVGHGGDPHRRDGGGPHAVRRVARGDGATHAPRMDCPTVRARGCHLAPEPSNRPPPIRFVSRGRVPAAAGASVARASRWPQRPRRLRPAVTTDKLSRRPPASLTYPPRPCDSGQPLFGERGLGSSTRIGSTVANP